MTNVSALPKENPAPETSSVDRTVDAVRLLLEALPPHERERAKRILGKELRPIETPRAGIILSTVVKLFPTRDKWTVKELKGHDSVQETGATEKELQNALAYLVRRNYVTRLGYGEYRAGGSVVSAAVEVEGIPVHNSEHYD